MSRWPGKYVIGLTGNIGTGKSVVRKMMEHLGAFSIDADALSHQATAKGGPAYAAVVKMFGEWMLTPEGDINRALLAKLVFAEPTALARLESLIHPFVGQAVDMLVNRNKTKVVVIEAIKLLEGDLAKHCNAVWVVHVPEAVQEARLVAGRKMPPTEARQRMAAQNPQAEKLKAANLVIDNSGSYEDTWTQVQAAFGKIMHTLAPEPAPTPPPVAAPATKPGVPVIKVRRGKPSDANDIAALVKAATNGQRSLSRAEVIANFGDKGYMLTEVDGKLSLMLGWKVENLVSRIDEFYLLPNTPLEAALPQAVDAVEAASRELLCEAALLFAPLPLAPSVAKILAGNEYAPQTPDKLGVSAWKEAAKESMPPNTGLLFKKLREDRVLKPI